MSVGKSAPDIAVLKYTRKRSLALPLSVLSPETLSEAYYIGKKKEFNLIAVQYITKPCLK